ncbi:MAG: insulinase family protein [Holosporales bacterium]|jgi:zinc protease|nr:insulinase family protein [Holosporales bacterium]
MMKLFWIAILCAIFTPCTFSEDRVQIDAGKQNARKQNDGQEIEIEEEVLENGLRVVVVHTKSKNSVVCGILYFVGFGDEPRNVVGISHFTEHMMFGGTTNLSSADLKKIIEKYNKASNAFTANDITFYHHQCKKEFLDINLKIEADRMQNLLLDEDYINRERNVIIEERKMRVESDPRQKYMIESAFKILYLYSTYSYIGIGYLDQINACDRAAIETHYNKFYTPNNAAVIIVGDITLREAVEKVKTYFGHIKKKGNAERNRIIDPDDTGLTYTMEHESDQIQMHDLDTIFNINPKQIDSMKKGLIAEMLSNIVAARDDSILHQILVDKKELAFTVGSYIDNRAFDKGRLSISMILRDASSVKIADKVMSDVIADFPSKYLTQEALEKEKAKLRDSVDMIMDNPASIAQWVVVNLGTGHSVSDIKNIRKCVRSIKLDDLKAAAKQIFTKKNRILQIYSHPKIAEKIEATHN